MSTEPALDLASIADEVLAADSRERAALAQLLDKALKPEGSLFVERAMMGGSESFVASVSLEWIGSHVRLASQLPLLKTHIVEGRVVIDAETVDLISQRDIDWSRQQELAMYLITRLTHKFPPVLAVITAPWVDEPDDDAWGADGRAVRSVVDFTALDNKRLVGLLLIDGDFNLYALDGQHRKIGIDGALDLVRKGRLQILTSDGTPKKGEDPIELDDLLVEYDLDAGSVQRLPAERMGIEIIPAVIAGETREEAQRRIRSVFTHVNKQAAPLTGGQVAQLDEDNGFAIIARNEAVSHDLLKKKAGRSPRVNFNSSTVSLKSQTLTTLQTLKEMAQRYLLADKSYKTWKAKGRLLPMRPDDAELKRGQTEFATFLSALGNLPSYQEMLRGKQTADLRRLAHEKPAGGQGHMLFRPIGQIALAQAVGILKNQDDLSLDAIFGKLAELDEAGGFQLDNVANAWYGVLFDPNSQRIRIKGRDLAANLLRYLVSGNLDSEERMQLTADLAAARYLGEIDQYRAFDGAVVMEAQIKLPPIL